MNFSKVKLVICLSLLIVNIIITVLCINLVNEKNYISENEAQLAEQHLQGMGITVKYDKTDRKLYNLPIYTVQGNTYSNGAPNVYKKITEAFFDTKIDDESYIKTPDGYIVSVKNTRGFLVGTSSLMEKTKFECYVDNAVNIKDINETAKPPYTQNLNIQEKGNEVKKAKKFINTAFQDYGTKVVYVGAREYAEGKIMSFCAELSGTKVLDLYINVYVKKDNIVCCVGNIIDSVPEKKYSTELIDSIDLMYLIPDYIRARNYSSRIADITVVDFSMNYKMFELKQDEYYIVPVWMVNYKDGTGSINNIIIDAVTGGNTGESE